jgi:hypothetical protein
MNNIDKLIKKFDEFESKLNFKKFPKIPVLKLSFGLITISTLTFIIFRPQINKYLSQEGSNISKNIIESPQLQVSIQNELVRLINDAYTKNEINNLTKQIINDKEVQDNVVLIFGKLLQREDVNIITKKFVIDIINSKEVENAIYQQVEKISKDEENNKNIGKIIKKSVYHSIWTK